MTRIEPVKVEDTLGKTRDQLDSINRSMKTVPNIFKVAAKAPAVLEGLLAFSRSLKACKLSAKEREQIAIVVAEINSCNYCLAAHSTLGKMAGMNEKEIVNTLTGQGLPERESLIISFAKAVVERRGQVSSTDYEQLMRSSVTEEEALEIVAVVVENIFTNYINNVAKTPLDFELPDYVRAVSGAR